MNALLASRPTPMIGFSTSDQQHDCSVAYHRASLPMGNDSICATPYSNSKLTSPISPPLVRKKAEKYHVASVNTSSVYHHNIPKCKIKTFSSTVSSKRKLPPSSNEKNIPSIVSSTSLLEKICNFSPQLPCLNEPDTSSYTKCEINSSGLVHTTPVSSFRLQPIYASLRDISSSNESPSRALKECLHLPLQTNERLPSHLGGNSNCLTFPFDSEDDSSLSSYEEEEDIISPAKRMNFHHNGKIPIECERQIRAKFNLIQGQFLCKTNAIERTKPASMLSHLVASGSRKEIQKQYPQFRCPSKSSFISEQFIDYRLNITNNQSDMSLCLPIARHGTGAYKKVVTQRISEQREARRSLVGMKRSTPRSIRL